MSEAEKLKGYNLVAGIEQMGRETFGLRIYLKAPEKYFQVFDYDIMKAAGVSSVSGTIEAEDFLEKIRSVQALIEPEVKKRFAAEVEYFKQVFLEAGLHLIYVETITNGYCSKACCAGIPWLIVTTSFGRIKIGWRKRVISIDWSDSDIKKSAETLFPNEDVTKTGCEIHAWSREKAIAYLHKLRLGELLKEEG